ncbi:carboxymuconolactone decarboxylase family protein [Streptomyces albiaxialis]|uniref:Carboxymuconolactone decarboxylase family protein n=1 Tax=Streptomyces albiaxialis TaxID=329523 RepID=A0ABP5H987_9ACTN
MSTPTNTSAAAETADTADAGVAADTDGVRLRSRLPDPVELFPEMATVIGSMIKATQNGTVPSATIGLVQLRAGQMVASSYHTIGRSRALREAGETEDRITAVSSWRDAPFFTEAERLALELVEAVLTPDPHGDRVPDELYARVAAHYDDQALWTLILAISQICFFIPIALVARPIPGNPPGQNYTD